MKVEFDGCFSGYLWAYVFIEYQLLKQTNVYINVQYIMHYAMYGN